jgi:hypothetical protein
MSQALQIGDTEVDGLSLADVCRRYSVRELSLHCLGPQSVAKCDRKATSTSW